MKQENVPLTSLRGIAAIWVVAHHLALRFVDTGLATPDRFLLPGGVAVDIFFILSGLVMAATYSALGPAGGPAFMVRRIFRVYPLHLFVLGGLVCFAMLRLVIGIPAAPGENWSRLPEAALLVQVFRDQPLTWNVASWSIGVEMACYLAFPLLLPLLRAVPGRLLIVLVLALTVLELLVLFEVGRVVSGPGAVARGFAGFSLGMALAFSLRGRQLPAWGQGPGELLTLSGAVGALAIGVPELTPIFGAALIGLLFTGRGPVAVALESAPLHWLGRISYSIYLMHLPVIGFAAMIYPPQNMSSPGLAGLVAWSLVVVVPMLALSHLSWRFVEEPGRRLGARLSRRIAPPAPAGASAAGVV